MSPEVSEVQVTRLWWELPGRTGLVTGAGESIGVIFPGRVNDGRGADIRDAVIVTGREVISGDVEIHVRSGDWRAHGHHRDPAYNRVVLHVVLENNTPLPTVLENGRTVPVLALEGIWSSLVLKYTGQSGRYFPVRRCAAARTNVYRTGEILDRAGDERFREKAERYRNELGQDEAGQVLYRGMLEALGYSRNRAPMRELADRLPLQRLLAAVPDLAMPAERATAYFSHLAGTTGLRPGRETPVTPMAPGEWHLYKVRPANHPERRLLVMARILACHRAGGLLDWMLKVIRETAPGGNRRLEEQLMAASGDVAENDDYRRWTGHSGPGGLLGRERAAAIIINVWLPLAAARGELTGDMALAERAIALFRDYPSGPGNAIERHMQRQLGLDRGTVGRARRLQGLLNIYRNYCIRGDCPGCPLMIKREDGHPETKENPLVRPGRISAGRR